MLKCSQCKCDITFRISGKLQCKECYNAHMRGFRRSRHTANICIDCGDLHTGPTHRCNLCRDKIAMKTREKKLRMIEYLGGKCLMCGESYPNVAVYDFHHRNPSRKDIKISHLNGCSWENTVKELDKCALLCANCHRKLHNPSKEDKEHARRKGIRAFVPSSEELGARATFDRIRHIERFFGEEEDRPPFMLEEAYRYVQ